jgi:Serine/threonine protein kinase
MTDLRDRLARALSGAYSIERELSGGGMSRVFVAREHALDRRVVVKVLPDDMAAAGSLQRFRREIMLAARLHHPHIVPVLAAGEVDGVPFYTMPLVDGDSLRDRLAGGPMPIGNILRVLREVSSALQYAHEHGIVHRDIKPDNVLLSNGVASVTDFGVAKALGAAAEGTSHALTSVGVALGTPMYMAPEQIAADPAVDERADLYAFGCVAYEMLTGDPPFGKRAPQHVLAAHITEDAVPVGERRRDVPAPLAALVMHCLAKSPEARPQTAADVIRALDAMTTGAMKGTKPARAFTRVGIAVGALALVLAAAVLAIGLRRRDEEKAAPRSVGVVPFTNLSAARENEYFSEGVTQEITTALGKVAGLRVASQTLPLQASAPDIRNIARNLGVDAVLEGSVQRIGDRVRITATLVSAATGYQLWSDHYDRELKDVFAVQDEIARAIVNGLRITLEPGVSHQLVRRETADPEAHRLYLEGMYYWNRRSTATLRKAMALFRQAIARDSAYAAPWAGLSLAYTVIIRYDTVDVGASSDTALAAGRHALALDSTSSDAMLGVAQSEFQTGHRAAGLRDFERAVALDSSNARVRHWYAEALVSSGRFDPGIKQIHRALALEPLNLTINTNVGRIELEARHFKEAEEAIGRAIELDSNFQAAHALRAALYDDTGRHEEAIRERIRYLQHSPFAKPLTPMTLLAYSYAIAGRRVQAESVLAEVERASAKGRRGYGPLAALYYALGRRNEAIATLDTGVVQNDAVLVMSSREQMYDALRKDPRGHALLERLEAVH